LVGAAMDQGQHLEMKSHPRWCWMEGLGD
jgi:hypothetical protein